MSPFLLTVRTMDREFFGPTFNGEALLPLLSRMDVNQALATDSIEGYSAAAIAFHIGNWKYQFLHHTGNSGLCDAPPFEPENFPPVPEIFTSADWNFLLAWLQSVHQAAASALLTLEPSMLGQKIDELGCTLEEFIAWLVTHDAYHTAQLRNMGLGFFRDTMKNGQ